MSTSVLANPEHGFRLFQSLAEASVFRQFGARAEAFKHAAKIEIIWRVRYSQSRENILPVPSSLKMATNRAGLIRLRLGHTVQ